MIINQFAHKWPLRHGDTGYVKVILDIGRRVDIEPYIIPWDQPKIGLVMRGRIDFVQHIMLFL